MCYCPFVRLFASDYCNRISQSLVCLVSLKCNALRFLWQRLENFDVYIAMLFIVDVNLQIVEEEEEEEEEEEM